MIAPEPGYPGLIARAECSVEQWFVRAFVVRDPSRQLIVSLAVSDFEHELDGPARLLVARRVERLVRWLIREEARNA
jgi:hypothetical protein